MHRNDSLSPRDLALALGVSESTARRWVDRGTVRSRRTQGGHRRISLSDALAFVRAQDAVVARPELLGLKDLPRASDAPLEGFHDALVAGRRVDAEGLLLREYLAGREVAELCDDVVAPAMARIGGLYDRDGVEGVFVEHRATGVCVSALNHLAARLPAPGKGHAVGGACPGDPYLLPSMMASLVLGSTGLAPTNLGPDTPLPVLRRAAETLNADVVWISVGVADDPRALAEDLLPWLDEVAGPNRTVVLGGRALATLELPSRPHVHQGASVRELAALGLGLRSRSGAA